ncbi:MAG: carbohydrate binding domain-containing protein [Methanosarcina sp.]|uniref:COG1470 family protein n=1 Tax=Methanosarcina sp. TaxID=2213 RepID=UPI00262F78B7|nr:carbohydrate binding domain-containing protein [Methanosarcina sp.]MDD3247930.1 carbohydrate binding domain-containing protein [Methanosarcina sp.]MDD4248173.1 carbohydrate binding domain-containing protein [Methanosarcina sp.]
MKSIKEFKSVEKLAVIVSIVVGMLGIYTIVVTTDFGISVSPMSGDAIQGTPIQTTVTVKDESPILKHYNYEVTLAANNLPNGISVTFSPNGGPKPTYVSNLIINVDKMVPPGDHVIEITGTSQDGSERTCKYMLNVKPSPGENFDMDPIGRSEFQGDVDENIIDTMDSTLGWLPFDEKMGSTEKVNSVSGMENDAVEIAYNLMKDGFVGISKNIDSEKLADAKGIRFYYKLSGEPNTIQIKLIDQDGLHFGTLFAQTKAVDDWTPIEVSFSNFDLWSSESAKSLNLKSIEKLEFVIANKPEFGDSPGTGSVFIDKIEVIE